MTAIQKAREALKPFADAFHDAEDQNLRVDATVYYTDGMHAGANENVVFKTGDFLAAASALAALDAETEVKANLTRPIIGIENRTAQEAFDIMCDRIRSALAPPESRS